MRFDIVFCFAGYALIPLCNALLIRWRLKQRDHILTFFQSVILFWVLAILAFSVGTVLSIIFGIGSGILQAIFTETNFNDGLRIGFDRAVPLDENEEIRPWGLLVPMLIGLGLNIVAHFLSLRIIKKPTND